MRFTGTLKSWNDERGFGFIEPHQGGDEIFVHIKAFPGGTGRPSVGQCVTFEVELGTHGKKRARAVQYPARSRGTSKPQPESPAPWTPSRVLVIPAFGALCYYVSVRWSLAPYVLSLYLIASIFAFIAYGVDKAAARQKRWRTRETTLHFFGLIGGWPGALLAQQLLRHKTAKPSFVAGFWVTVAANVVAFVAWHASLSRIF
jgi:uncharacterized membrane protein YsdA (DUF1294 family)/cold shock CspA family protein